MKMSLLPDVTEILDDPEVGGGVAFEVQRVLNTRHHGAVTQTVTKYSCTGNIQPAGKSSQTSTSEALLTEDIQIYTTFPLSTGSNDGLTFTESDRILYDGKTWKVVSVQNWEKWGFTIGTATRMMG